MYIENVEPNIRHKDFRLSVCLSVTIRLPLVENFNCKIKLPLEFYYKTTFRRKKCHKKEEEKSVHNTWRILGTTLVLLIDL